MRTAEVEKNPKRAPRQKQYDYFEWFQLIDSGYI